MSSPNRTSLNGGVGPSSCGPDPGAWHAVWASESCLITDLCEGGNEAQLVRRMSEMAAAGVKALCLLALSDHGAPYHDERLARKLSGLGVPGFACNPMRLPDLVEGALRGVDLTKLATKTEPAK
jgi:hypothetical protein